MVFKFESTNGVSDFFNRIRLAMSPIISRIDAPFIARSMMGSMQNTIHDRISHIQIRRGHINLCSKDTGAILEFSGTHLFKKIKVLLHRSIAIGTVFTRLSQGAPIFSYLFGA